MFALSSVEKKIEDLSGFCRYISNILVFLGLLGTFWGLSLTIANVAGIIDGLGLSRQSSPSESFEILKNSLKAPLGGMGTAFECSLFGLSGSLVVGFLNMAQKSVASEFLYKVEEWLAKRTIPKQEHGDYHGETFSMALIERTVETMQSFQSTIGELISCKDETLTLYKDLCICMKKMTESITANQDIVNTINKTQMELQETVYYLAKKLVEEYQSKAIQRLDSIDAGINKLIKESCESKKSIIQSLGGDIRMISKILSVLIRE
jgi:hypothetical protein